MAINNGYGFTGGVGEEGDVMVQNPPPSQPPSLQLNQQLKLSMFLLKDKSWVQNNCGRLLENKIREMVRQGVEHAIQHSSISPSRSFSTTRVEPFESRKYKLEFEGKLPRKFFTGNNLGAKGLAPLKIRLLDVVSKQVITDGPLSSKKVEIVALHGHFKAEQLEEWTKRDFNGSIVTERHNKRPLLVGQCTIPLRNGIGLVDNVCFTDSSCWVRSKMFRFGAKLVGEQDQVMEAVSNPFRVKDRRGETYEKHDIPSPDDEVWRLCWIGKSGKIHTRLKEERIHKVKDLVTQYHSDQSKLRRILKVTRKKWDEIIKQATSCLPKDYCMNQSADLAHQLHIPMDQQNFTGSQSVADAGEHIYQPEQSMLSNNLLLDELFVESCGNVSLPIADYSMPSLSTTMFNVQNSSWLLNQTMSEDGTGMLSSVPNVNVTNWSNPRTSLSNIG